MYYHPNGHISLNRNNSELPDIHTILGRKKIRNLVEATKTKQRHDSAIITKTDLERIKIEAKLLK